MKYAAAFIGLALACAICAWLPIPELLGLVIVFLVFFAILGFAEEIGDVLESAARERQLEERLEASAPTRVLDPAGVVVSKRQPVRVLDPDQHPCDSGEVTSVGQSGVVVRFPDSSLETFPVRLHRDDRHLHVEGLEVDPVVAV